MHKPTPPKKKKSIPTTTSQNSLTQEPLLPFLYMNLNPMYVCEQLTLIKTVLKKKSLDKLSKASPL